MKILVIGASSAIAKHCSRLWANSGHEIYLVARNNQQLANITYDLELRGAIKVSSYCLDLNDTHRHIEMLDAAEATLGTIDIVLIAHGTLSNQKNCEVSVEETLAEINTNAISTISLLTHIANRLEANRAGTIAVISSVAGDRGKASNYVYGSAKAMITVFMSGLRQRLHQSGVTVLTIKPGFVDTPMTARFKKSIFWVSPHVVARNIIQAINNKQNEIYVPKFWRLVMIIIRIIPNKIFRKIRL